MRSCEGRNIIVSNQTYYLLDYTRRARVALRAFVRSRLNLFACVNLTCLKCFRLKNRDCFCFYPEQIDPIKHNFRFSCIHSRRLINSLHPEARQGLGTKFQASKKLAGSSQVNSKLYGFENLNTSKFQKALSAITQGILQYVGRTMICQGLHR